ncbi:A/G-specific adenine glycosylase [Pneumocystis carinii B80]|uniref:Adenine DNA glycosylase n=1 Tax=Pneumocystis carinii (strain B80) TaxID=1408658 RepID=A0A0W4ZSP5_PNEC8|nr:A/G-specific adenine glycosylase [Pneumocystis carinii B80]KTW31403.1 A/G-specific adenine glycosylase [Pneumocystis carinii B80]
MIGAHKASSHTFEDVKHIRKSLLAWYRSNARILPWRKPYVNPPTISMSSKERTISLQRAYEVLVSEMMLQQTQVVTVVPYFERWMKKFPTWDVLETADLEEVQNIWAGLGYYARARRMKEAAMYFMELERRSETIPTDVATWVKNVPGCGEYTAGAVLSVAWNIRCPIVDGNVIRVLTRLRAVGADCHKGIGKKWVWDSADQLVDNEYPGDFNQALMELGATVCTPVNPNCDICPLNMDCLALKEAKNVLKKNIINSNNEEHDCNLCPIEELGQFISIKTYISSKYPRKAIKKKTKLQENIVFVFLREKNMLKEYYLEKRPPKGLLAGLWDFKTLPIDIEQKYEIQDAENHAKTIVSGDIIGVWKKGDTLHQFTHIRQISYVYLVVIDINAEIRGKGTWMTEEIMKNQSIPELTWKNFRQAANNEKKIPNKTKKTNKRLKVNDGKWKQTSLSF